MVEQGTLVYGNRPTGSPNMEDIGKELEYMELVEAMWDNPRYGKGRVFHNMTLAQALQKAEVEPDIAGEALYFKHREVEDGDIYFLNNHSDNTISSAYKFKTKYQYAQLWSVVSGTRYQLPITNGEVQLDFAPRESYLVVFSNRLENLPQLPQTTHRQRIDSVWSVDFDTKLNGAGRVLFPTLTPWNEHDNPNIRYFSGVATYKNSFKFDGSSTPVLLQLPQSGGYVAKVYINSKEAGSVWCSPWSVDISRYLINGDNTIEISVANTWTNRMVGDVLVPISKRVTTNPEELVGEDTPLQPSGLVGEIYLCF